MRSRRSIASIAARNRGGPYFSLRWLITTSTAELLSFARTATISASTNDVDQSAAGGKVRLRGAVNERLPFDLQKLFQPALSR